MSKKKAVIRPGLNVDCVIKVNENQKMVDVRKSQVYDLDDNIMIISQTDPEILSSLKGHRIAITYVSQEDGQRMGLSCRISRVVTDYRLSSSEKVGAVYLSDLSEEPWGSGPRGVTMRHAQANGDHPDGPLPDHGL